MKLVRSFVTSVGVVLMVMVAACSSDNSSSSNSCNDAKTVADSCNAKGSADGGASISITFDPAACAQSDQGKKAADCIVANKSNCDCILKCSLTGSCS